MIADCITEPSENPKPLLIRNHELNEFCRPASIAWKHVFLHVQTVVKRALDDENLLNP